MRDVSDREWPDLRWSGDPDLLPDLLMDDWTAMITARCPWNEMFLDDVSGEFRAVLKELLRPRGQFAPHECAARLRGAAREHGAYRRRQGYHAVILAEELAVAEDAIAAAIERSGAPAAVIADIQSSLRPVLRALERAMYSGYADCITGPESAR